jgi:hypothetical protein
VAGERRELERSRRGIHYHKERKRKRTKKEKEKEKEKKEMFRGYILG